MKEFRTYKLKDAKYGKIRAVIVDENRVAIEIGNLATFVDRKWFFENYVEIKASRDRRRG
ncbi:hypothetical protein [Priestia megaterium]|uniref:hypothetical protein n=1 Tax=Priestia megaterium TaxID=1404 RepID=UPI000BFB3B1B|nr:hypothetical protein [Priestia megaterium]PGO60664.1 hypothetical protein CN981_08935 [Priestia megaterium]